MLMALLDWCIWKRMWKHLKVIVLLLRDRVKLDTRARSVLLTNIRFVVTGGIFVGEIIVKIIFEINDQLWQRWWQLAIVREEESRSRLEERGGALDGYIKGWNRSIINIVIVVNLVLVVTIVIVVIIILMATSKGGTGPPTALLLLSSSSLFSSLP